MCVQGAEGGWVGGPVTPHARAMAAVPACGPGAVLSDRSAAALWELGVRWSAPLEVTTRWDRRRKGIRVHRGRLDRRDVTRQFGIPVTTPARTLLDVAEQLDRPTLTRAVNEARLAHRATLTDLAELVARSPGPRDPAVATVRRARRRAHPLALRGRVPRVRRRARPPHARGEPDRRRLRGRRLLEAQRLILELDGKETHEDAFEADRDRDTTLLDAGFPVLRITWNRLNGAPQREADRLHSLLDQRSTAAGPAA